MFLPLLLVGSIHLVRRIIIKAKNVYVGFRCYIVFSSKDIIGPITPSFGAPSFSNVPSCHAEVGAIKYALSLKKKFKKAKLICTRWSYDKINNTWNLVDGIPCKTCMKYIISKMENIKEIIISRKDGLHTMNINEALKLTRLSTWVLYGT